jgi:paraquat-inducible protein B
LYRYRGIAMKEPDPVERRYALYFNESVRGLSIGAPVTLFGLQVGEVTDVGLTYDAKTTVFRPRVIVTFFPDRLVAALPTGQRTRTGKTMAEMTPEERIRIMRRVVEDQGLRAQLRTGSLLTGELYVAFEYFPDAPKVKVDWSKDPLELPVMPGSLASIEAKLGSILNKIDRLPLDAIGQDVRKALGTLDATLKDANVLVNRVDTQWVPEGQKTLEDLRRAIVNADRVVQNADTTLFSKDSPAPQDLRDMLQEITRAARSVRVLVDYLERHPDTLIRGKPTEKQ